MPNFRGKRFTNAHETLIWAGKSEKSKYTFNYDSMKALNEDLQMRSDWFIPLCTGNERLKDKDGVKVHPTQKPEDIKAATKRIKAIQPWEEESVEIVNKREQMRIPFGWLLEQGLLEPGTELSDPKGKNRVKINADGNIKTHAGNHRGSIHKVGAAVQNAPSCNGWTYWHYKDGDKLQPIDNLRQRLRSSIEKTQIDASKPNNSTIQ